MSNFNEWLDTFVEEKEIDVDRSFEVYADDGTWNLIPVGSVIEYIKQVGPDAQASIKDTFVKIDFANGDVYHFLEYMAAGMAKIHGEFV